MSRCDSLSFAMLTMYRRWRNQVNCLQMSKSGFRRRGRAKGERMSQPSCSTDMKETFFGKKGEIRIEYFQRLSHTGLSASTKTCLKRSL